MNERTFTVFSSNGYLEVDRKTGKILSRNIVSDDENFPKIYIIDIKEFEQYYECEIMSGVSIDILDLGYWLKDGTYEPPTQDWRDEIKNNIDIEDKHEYRHEPKKAIKVEPKNNVLSNLTTLSQKIESNTKLVQELGDDYKKALDLLAMAQMELNKFYLPDQCEALHLINKFLKDKK